MAGLASLPQAASEIGRLMNAVRHNVTVDDVGRCREIEADTKAALLSCGTACAAVVDAARGLERSAPAHNERRP